MEMREKIAARMKWLFPSLVILAVLMFLAAVIITVDRRYFRPVRELSHVPGARLLQQKGIRTPLISDQVNGIRFSTTVITADNLRNARESPEPMESGIFVLHHRVGCGARLREASRIGLHQISVLHRSARDVFLAREVAQDLGRRVRRL